MHRVHLLPLLLHLAATIIVESRLLRSIKTKYSASVPGSAPPPAQAVPLGNGRKILDTGRSTLCPVESYLKERTDYLLMEGLAMGTVEAIDGLVLLLFKEAVGDSINCLLDASLTLSRNPPI